jgi:hypothetical protein
LGDAKPFEIHVRKYVVKRRGEEATLTIAEATATRQWVAVALRNFIVGDVSYPGASCCRLKAADLKGGIVAAQRCRPAFAGLFVFDADDVVGNVDHVIAVDVYHVISDIYDIVIVLGARITVTAS